jgi:flagellar biosynthesis/type III secretory pathway M-ring protein FliF/YscJ
MPAVLLRIRAGGLDMEVLKQQWLRIQQQMSGLTVSQRMLAASLVAIMVMTVLYWGRYAATPDRVAVLEQSFAAEQAARVVAELRSMNIDAVVGSDGRVMVPSDRKMDAFAAVAYQRMLPSDSVAAVDKIVGQMTLWDSSAKTDRLFNEKKEVMLAQTIQRFPGVAEAVVHIDPAERKTFSAPSEPRASINIRMRENDRPTKKLVMAAADTVLGAQSGMKRSGISVIVDGVSYPLPDRDGESMMMSGEILETKQGYERHFAGKIREQLADIPNVFVAVTVDVNTRRTEQERSEVDPNNVIQKETQASNRSDESTQPTPGATDAGAIPNAGIALPAGGGGGGSTLSNEEKTTFEVDYGRTRTRTFQPAGDGTVTAASVRVPRSHFLGIWRSLNPKADNDPDEATLGNLMATQLAKIRRDVMACTGLKDEQAVTVDFYVDTEPLPLNAGSGPSVPVMTLVGSYGKEVALGAMALMAMFMVTGLVKKSSSTVHATAGTLSPEEQRNIERLAGSDEIVGAAAEGATALEALELDDETSQTQQMVNQVSNMVKDNPDAAVSLVKRWLNRS